MHHMKLTAVHMLWPMGLCKFTSPTPLLLRLHIFRSPEAMSDTLKVDLLLQELKNMEWDTLGTYLGLSQSVIGDIVCNH